MDALVEKTSALILKEGIEDWRGTLSQVANKLRGKQDLRHIRWALQDSLHRAVITNARENILDRMFIDEQENW